MSPQKEKGKSASAHPQLEGTSVLGRHGELKPDSYLLGKPRLSQCSYSPDVTSEVRCQGSSQGHGSKNQTTQSKEMATQSGKGQRDDHPGGKGERDDHPGTKNREMATQGQNEASRIMQLQDHKSKPPSPAHNLGAIAGPPAANFMFYAQ